MEDPSPPEVANPEVSRKNTQQELKEKAEWFKAGVPLLPPRDDEKKGKEEFSSQFQYLMSVIGMSVGLGNIWRFPTVVYENGGGAFLIPYLCMGMLFGLPMLYLDSSIGQFMQNSPSIVFWQLFPAAQGLGWTMGTIIICVGFYYSVPICWSFMYIVKLVLGNMEAISNCNNDWSTASCHNGSAPQEFFEYVITKKHGSFSFGEFNVLFALCSLVCWALIAAGLLKGVQSMGKVSMITTMLPYIIITILFFRGITLEGANEGIKYFYTETEWERIWMMKTWKEALSQCMFSLSIGCGPMIMMSSYNKRQHPNLRDCVIILCADTFMSIMGGTAVFSILGSMTQKTGKNMTELVTAPLTLTFIAYPEAISEMPVPTLWALLFFAMMFMVGMSTMLAIVEGFATCIIDEIPRLAKWHWLVVTLTCVICYLLNLVCFSFQNGYLIFNILSDNLGTVALSGCLFFEILIIMVYYGAPRLFRDIQCMHGLPTSLFSRLFGSVGLFIKILVSITAPLLSVTMVVVICVSTGIAMYKGITENDTKTETINGEKFKYPWQTIPIGFALAIIPIILVPIGAFVNFKRNKKAGKPMRNLFRVQEDHPSIRYNLPDPVSWRDFFWPPLRTKIAPLPESTKPMAFTDPEPDFNNFDQAESLDRADTVSDTSTVELNE